MYYETLPRTEMAGLDSWWEHPISSVFDTIFAPGAHTLTPEELAAQQQRTMTTKQDDARDAAIKMQYPIATDAQRAPLITEAATQQFMETGKLPLSAPMPSSPSVSAPTSALATAAGPGAMVPTTRLTVDKKTGQFIRMPGFRFDPTAGGDKTALYAGIGAAVLIGFVAITFLDRK